jgi:putative transposase
MASVDDYRRGRHIVSALHVHLVFVTKYRREVLDDAMLRLCDRTFIRLVRPPAGVADAG